jgi:hypothetical protein
MMYQANGSTYADVKLYHIKRLTEAGNLSHEGGIEISDRMLYRAHYECGSQYPRAGSQKTELLTHKEGGIHDEAHMYCHSRDGGGCGVLERL